MASRLIILDIIHLVSVRVNSIVIRSHTFVLNINDILCDIRWTTQLIFPYSDLNPVFKTAFLKQFTIFVISCQRLNIAICKCVCSIKLSIWPITLLNSFKLVVTKISRCPFISGRVIILEFPLAVRYKLASSYCHKIFSLPGQYAQLNQGLIFDA